MKGQYYLLGAIILTMLFFTGLYLVKTESMFTTSYKSDDMKFLFYDIQSEYPRAFNFGINESDITGKLRNFTEFTNNMLTGSLINFTSLWIYTINISDNLNVTVGNHLGYDTIVQLNISGSVQNLSVMDGGINSTIFPVVGSKFNMTVNFNSNQKKLSMMRDKYNLYSYIQLQRANEMTKGGVLA